MICSIEQTDIRQQVQKGKRLLRVKKARSQILLNHHIEYDCEQSQTAKESWPVQLSKPQTFVAKPEAKC